ncbi:RPC7L polymerase, partial [Prunella fulvescens]|nr:RPC7L polymerase [Prunella fulvescens]
EEEEEKEEEEEGKEEEEEEYDEEEHEEVKSGGPWGVGAQGSSGATMFPLCPPQETDYVLSYFDNGESFGPDSDDNGDEAVY